MEKNALGLKCDLCGGKGWVDCGINAAFVLAGLDDDCPKCRGSGHTQAKLFQDSSIENDGEAS